MTPDAWAARALARAVRSAWSLDYSTGDVDLFLAELAYVHELERDAIHEAAMARRLHRFCWGNST